jgi:sucrose phosphorylase
MLLTRGNEIQGVMLNAYPDSVGENLGDMVSMLKLPEFREAFSLFYILPTFFNSDLDRGFSIIDYNINEELVTKKDLRALEDLGIELKFDIVLNHLSVASPQFKNLLALGERSPYKDFFIDWNTFWSGNGKIGDDGVMIPKKKFLDKLFMRKSGLPILKVDFPDGIEKPYWNTFYQDVSFKPIKPSDLKNIDGIDKQQTVLICDKVNKAIKQKTDLSTLNFEVDARLKSEILQLVYKNRSYLGQMDLNAKSPMVWDFYRETLSKLNSYGCKIVRLDAFAYLNKEVGQSNFFNTPGTWEYLKRIQQIAQEHNLVILPEIHSEYGTGFHRKVAEKGYPIYDFFLPGLMIHTLENKSNMALLNWGKEIVSGGYKTINMLGCHDGIPIIDLKGKEFNGHYSNGLLGDIEIEYLMDKIIDRGGKVKNLYGPSGEKISYYQVNATFFSALGNNQKKLLMARAIQLFFPGTPQIWYLDLFAGKNDEEAVERAGKAAHKEINRTTLKWSDIENGLKRNIVRHQLKLIQMRNTSEAFKGEVTFNESSKTFIDISWTHNDDHARLKADLNSFDFEVIFTRNGRLETLDFN